MISKLGFSVVAPISVIVPASTCGRKASCCALLKRWISSANRIVPRPVSSRSSASRTISRTRGTPSVTAENGDELAIGVSRDQPRERRLPGARRSPEHHRRHVAPLDALAQRHPRREEMLLADVLLERARTHARRERLRWRRRREQRRAAGRGRAGRDAPAIAHAPASARATKYTRAPAEERDRQSPAARARGTRARGCSSRRTA